MWNIKGALATILTNKIMFWKLVNSFKMTLNGLSNHFPPFENKQIILPRFFRMQLTLLVTGKNE